MKPSKRLYEIEKEIHITNYSSHACQYCNDSTRLLLDALVVYLDEQYERNKTPEQRQMEIME